ncbi:hypothetical protein SCB71_14640 [Herbiconiux sp. KACC 21604]|uniref:hypothetical protein n=1 Tax=unclassified Herbiconiux TaxID=2618217 RepID=UPI00149184F0|nr:hypothetical protein [Herbiconiux sp. SALV-R1]QJU54380.1 hypothetical protein HL652_12580 [Herbiconiux sp. SALV-R1]WPO85451.1 hypothetical protein SCB71_14640 [Herbiconiux sp. KACC 21604]
MDQVEIDRAILWHFGDQGLGKQPGDFMYRLIRAIAVADPSNRDKLATAFPQLVAVFADVAYTPDGLERVRQRVIAAVVPA